MTVFTSVETEKKRVSSRTMGKRLIGHVRVPKTPTFKMRPSAQPFL